MPRTRETEVSSARGVFGKTTVTETLLHAWVNLYSTIEFLLFFPFFQLLPRSDAEGTGRWLCRFGRWARPLRANSRWSVLTFVSPRRSACFIGERRRWNFHALAARSRLTCDTRTQQWLSMPLLGWEIIKRRLRSGSGEQKQTSMPISPAVLHLYRWFRDHNSFNVNLSAWR